MKTGDYVLATKYSDGDPNDQWAVGFYVEQRGIRHWVEDGSGHTFRPSGFRHVRKITPTEGSFLLTFPDIESTGLSLFRHLRRFKDSMGLFK